VKYTLAFFDGMYGQGVMILALNPGFNVHLGNFLARTRPRCDEAHLNNKKESDRGVALSLEYYLVFR